MIFSENTKKKRKLLNYLTHGLLTCNVMFSTCVYLCCLFCVVCFSVFIVLLLFIVLVIVHCSCYYSFATLTEVFPCFFLSCKANARV
jgi:hypothetical protein